MNPADHEGRADSPFIEFAESAGVVDDDAVLTVPGLTFDDLMTGDIPVHGRPIRATPAPTAPVPVQSAVGFGVLPRLVSPRHARAQKVSTAVRHVLVASGCAVCADAGLIMGLLAGLEALGGAR